MPDTDQLTDEQIKDLIDAHKMLTEKVEAQTIEIETLTEQLEATKEKVVEVDPMKLSPCNPIRIAFIADNLDKE